MIELNTFKALLVEETDNKQFTLNIVNRSVSDLPENDLLVNVHYSSLNYKDALSASGNKRVSAHFPHTPGIDAAGVVVRDKSGTFSPGDEVVMFGPSHPCAALCGRVSQYLEAGCQ